MQTVEQKLAVVDASLRRWQTRLTRASNMVVKLARQRRRLTNNMATVRVEKAKPVVETPLPELDVFFKPEPAEQIAALDVPEYLRRTSVQPKETEADKRVREIMETKGPVPGPKMLEDLLNPAAAMNRKRLERNDAKRRGYTLPPKVDKTAMPLSGRAALAAIKGKKK